MIRSLIKLLLKFIYKILSVFHLQFALAVLLIGVVLYFTGVVDKYYAIKLVLEIALVISAVYAIFATLNSLLGGKKQKNKSHSVQIVDQDKQKKQEVDGGAEEERQINQAPVYFKIKDNPEYVMAEHSDRYELFRITEKGLVKIRTDYKN